MLKRVAVWLASAATLACFLSLAALAAPPDGKGKPKDEEPPPPPLPADLDVRYRVHYLPVPEHEDFWHHDLNEVYESVGGWDNPGRTIRTGFYYSALTRTFLNATDMFTLPEGWVSTHFTGINNLGTIVGFATDDEGKQKGIIVYPVDEGFAWEFLPSPVDLDGLPVDEFRAWTINDVEDVMGVYWQINPDGSRTKFAFAYNSGRLNADTNDYSLPMTPLGISVELGEIIELINDRRAFVWDFDFEEGYWFDFVAAQTLFDEDPGNDTEPLSQAWIPEDWDIAGPGGMFVGVSNDGQLAVNSRREVSRKGRRVTYAYTPGVIQDDGFLWEGPLDEGAIASVNSESGSGIGDILSARGASNPQQWILHADHPEWGPVDLRSMLVFDTAADEELSDEELWDLVLPDLLYMSDRDPVTGFGVMIASNFPVVLMPEITSD